MRGPTNYSSPAQKITFAGEGLAFWGGGIPITRRAPSGLRAAFAGKPRQNARRPRSKRALNIVGAWFAHESSLLVALNALISVGVLAFAISMTFGADEMHWPAASDLELGLGLVFLVVSLMALLRRKRGSLRKIFAFAVSSVSGLVGAWFLAAWFYGNHSALFFRFGLPILGERLASDLSWFDSALAPLVAPGAVALIGLVFAARQLKSVRRSLGARAEKTLALLGLVASLFTMTVGVYAEDFSADDFFANGAANAVPGGSFSENGPLFAEGTSCHVSALFGPRRDPFNGRRTEFHPGVDLAVAQGTPVHAMTSGHVVFSGADRGFGNMVAIRADDGGKQPLTFVAAHMERLFAVTGRALHAGDVIGLAGSTGRSTGPHVHLQVCLDGRRNRSGGFVCGAAENPYFSWQALSAIAHSDCTRGPVV